MSNTNPTKVKIKEIDLFGTTYELDIPDNVVKDKITVNENLILGVGGHLKSANGQASGDRAVALGNATKATAADAFAEGAFTEANALTAHAEGYETKASGDYGSHAEGFQTQALARGAHSEGENTAAEEQGAHSEGQNTAAKSMGSHSEGIDTKAEGNGSHAEGISTLTQSWGAHAEGISTKALEEYSHAEGVITTTKSRAAHAEGESTIAEGQAAHAEGYISKTSARAAHAEGSQTEALAEASHTEGYKTKATANNAHAEGAVTVASGNSSHAEGYYTEASGKYSHAGGANTKASGDYSLAQGIRSKATGKNTYAIGADTIAEADHAIATGNETKASGTESIALGYSTWAGGKHSVAEGANTIASGENAHSSGSLTIAAGENSYAGGCGNYGAHIGGFVGSSNSLVTTADYLNPPAVNIGDKVLFHCENKNLICTLTSAGFEGEPYMDADGWHYPKYFVTSYSPNPVEEFSDYFSQENQPELYGIVINANEALHANSFIHGTGLKSGRDSQTVFGQYNTNSSEALFIIGNGQNIENRSNAFAALADGRARVYGAPTEDFDVVRKVELESVRVSTITHEMIDSIIKSSTFPKTKTFTIDVHKSSDGTFYRTLTFSFVEGMTWNDFANYYSGDGMFYGTPDVMEFQGPDPDGTHSEDFVGEIFYQGSQVYKDDTIIEGGVYTLSCNNC
jgi:hypothetical protein